MKAMQVMSALSQPTRWETFRLLIDALPNGLTAGEIADAVSSSPNTMSAHFAVLTRAGIVTAEKQGRTVIYRAAPESVMSLSKLLAEASQRR